VKSKPAVLSLLLAASLLTAVRAGASPTPTELFGFNGTNGQDPAKLIQAPDGNLYGITYLYSYRQGGTVFKLTPGGQFTQLFATHPSPSDASFFPDGNFFGDLAEGVRRLSLCRRRLGRSVHHRVRHSLECRHPASDQQVGCWLCDRSRLLFLRAGEGPTSIVPGFGR
jgi:hypothetical protein